MATGPADSSDTQRTGARNIVRMLVYHETEKTNGLLHKTHPKTGCTEEQPAPNPALQKMLQPTNSLHFHAWRDTKTRNRV